MIYKASLEDTAKIASVGRISFFDAHHDSSSNEDMKTYLDEKFNLEAIEEEISDLKNIFHVYKINNEIKGYSKIILNSPCDHKPNSTNSCKLERLYLLKEMYGKGAGKSMMENIINLCSLNHQSGIWLTVWIKNERAIKFYQNYGFSTIGEIMFKVGNTLNANHLMWLNL